MVLYWRDNGQQHDVSADRNRYFVLTTVMDHPSTTKILGALDFELHVIRQLGSERVILCTPALNQLKFL